VRWCHKALREPLLHFVAAGAVLFLIGQAIRARSDTHRIVITPQREAQLANRYALQFGARPDPGMMEELIKSDVHDEILFREGVAMGLDKDDEIIRRRIIQKMQFLLEDLQVPPEPDARQSQAYYRSHATQYQLPARASFSHIYFSLDRGDASARSRAQAALTTLQHAATATIADVSATPGPNGAANAGRATPVSTPERAPAPGDPFPDLYDFADYSRAQVERLFGPTQFAVSIFSVPLGKWAGPFKSAYGWHLIYVQSRAGAREQPFAAVRDKVRADYLLDSQKRTNDSAFAALARQFTVGRP
jgi:peptidyl-prolyl cis-trans isomerase C